MADEDMWPHILIHHGRTSSSSIVFFFMEDKGAAATVRPRPPRPLFWRKWQETIFIFSPQFSFKINLIFSDRIPLTTLIIDNGTT